MNMTIDFNNRRGQRGRQHKNLVAARLPDGRQVIFEFKGVNVSGVLTITKKTYKKDGKWSADYWTVELADGVVGFSHNQNWGTGEWLVSGTWEGAIKEILWSSKDPENFYKPRDLDDTAIERFVRATWPDHAARLDEARNNQTANPFSALEGILKDQENG